MTGTELTSYLLSHDNYMIVCHRNPDGDTVGSASALCLGLRSLGKKAFVLPDWKAADKRLEPYRNHLAPPDDYTADTVISVDTAAVSLLQENAPKQIDLAVDHHVSHKPYSIRRYVEHTAACGEIIYQLLTDMNVTVTREMAEPLYMAVATDTGCFRYGNTTPQSHRIAMALMETGFDFLSVNETFFMTKSAVRLKIEQTILPNLEILEKGTIAVLTLPLSLVKELNATASDTDELSALPRLIEGVQIGITIQEKEGFCRVSLRTSKAFSAVRICAVLGGGGHEQAGGCTVNADVPSTRAAVLNALYQVYPNARICDC
jgi:phosphoesterase RecJ-like protein